LLETPFFVHSTANRPNKAMVDVQLNFRKTVFSATWPTFPIRRLTGSRGRTFTVVRAVLLAIDSAGESPRALLALLAFSVLVRTLDAARERAQSAKPDLSNYFVWGG
jgi:hypothetical protein